MSNPVNRTEIARRAGVAPETVSRWRQRAKEDRLAEPFPEPRWEAGRIVWWDWDEVSAWLHRTGRMERAS